MSILPSGVHKFLISFISQAVAGTPFRTQTTFQSYDAVKQVAVFRAVSIQLTSSLACYFAKFGFDEAAGVMSYMNSGLAFEQFQMTHLCVNDVWYVQYT